jgi:formylmethanofuran dehydrogenase subunit C
MTPLTLTLKAAPTQRVDLSPLTPERLHGLNRAAIGGIGLQSGNRKIAVKELFTISGTDTQDIHIHGNCSKIDSIGAGTSSGSITVHGRAGHRVGAAMSGGRVVVRGNVGDRLGNGMNGGEIEVRGDAGDWVGAGDPGEAHGMNKGAILITGNAGARVGERMRRGTIIVKQNVGDYCGARMLAGTIVVLGTAGEFTGLGMHRGTIILSRRPKNFVATFNSCGILKMQFLRILRRQMAHTYHGLVKLPGHSALCELYCGDMSLGGKGELMVLRGGY